MGRSCMCRRKGRGNYSEENFRDYALMPLLDEVVTIKKVAIFFTVLAALEIVGTLIMFIIK